MRKYLIFLTLTLVLNSICAAAPNATRSPSSALSWWIRNDRILVLTLPAGKLSIVGIDSKTSTLLESGVSSVWPSPTGKWFAVLLGNGNLVLFDVNGARHADCGSGTISSVSWSPDEASLMYQTSDATGSTACVIYEIATRKAKTIRID